jgi:PAS domain S-box-containing protein
MKAVSKPGASVSRPLRVLIVDDSKTDVELLLRALLAGGFEARHQIVDTPEAMRTAMEGQEWDVITSDHAMPQFSGPAALALAQEICPHVPFIIVSGEIDLNLAVSLIKGGAQDYVQKDEMVRLVPVIERVLHDVEARREQRGAEQALQLSETRYRRLFETAQDGILIVNAETGQIEDANPFLLDLVGFSLEEYMGKKLWEIGVFKDSEASKSAFLELQSKGYIRYEDIPLHTRTGGSVEVEFVSNVYMVDDKSVIQCNIRDISERRQAEAEIRTLNAELKQRMQALQVSEVRYRRLFETAQDGILIVDADTGQIDDVNPFLLDLVGYSRENYLGKKMWEVAVFKDEEASKATFLELQKTGYIRYEDIPVRTSAGGCVDVEFVSNVYLVDQKRVIQCNIRDITERKHAEGEIRGLNADLERRVQARTAQVEALNKAAESFNYSVSHDLRAPLRRITGFVKVLEEDCAGTLDAAGKRLIGKILASTQHMTALIEALLKLASLSRKALQREPTSLSSLVHVVANELQQSDPGRHVEFVIAEGITAAGDANLLRIVIENLLENAWKFTSQLAAARIEFGVTRQTHKPAAYFVRDNGAGFDMKFADKLFGAFQRLHSESEFPGTGIGLASVQRIVDRHGGHIWAESAVGQGATFYFVLEAGPKDRTASALPLLDPLLSLSSAGQ